MNIELSTPALLFPALSLLMLAYTNRFLSLAGLVRHLHSTYKSNPDNIIFEQIKNLQLRLQLVRYMQAIGATSIFLCVFAMFLVFADYQSTAKSLFAFSLIFTMISLGISIFEISISTNALKLQLKDMVPK